MELPEIPVNVVHGILSSYGVFQKKVSINFAQFHGIVGILLASLSKWSLLHYVENDIGDVGRYFTFY